MLQVICWQGIFGTCFLLFSFTSKPVFHNEVYPKLSSMNLQSVFCYFLSAKIVFLSLTLRSLYYEINRYFEGAFSNYMHLPGHHPYLITPHYLENHCSEPVFPTLTTPRSHRKCSEDPIWDTPHENLNMVVFTWCRTDQKYKCRCRDIW